ncbi:response regulator receiver signal transduction histidine kinase [Calothrix parasitica NIES-267]|uniref:Circadian input-output histidine kinase CikA n=1 Tax=Calothrix parasitica NIES-267 TaxID=1973488 RepID=A0A1Z4LP71_9CYAN|nr:response regulator receiver signal transduction histidine kinase [Calothrix parasitica NIES-267]
MEETLKILIIDDDEVDRMAVTRALKAVAIRMELSEATDYSEAVEILEEKQFDCVFVDYLLPGKDGLALVKEIRASGSKVPLIVLTGQGDEKTAVDLMKAGASDYITKSRITSDLLSTTLRNVIRVYEAELQVESFNNQLRESNELLRKKNKELEEKKEQIHLQNLKLLQASETKSKFLATMSHELRTPLNAIMAFSQMLQRKNKGNFSNQQVDMIERIHGNGKNLLALINDILDLSKIEAGGLKLYPEEFDLSQLINTTVDELRSLRSQKKLDIEVEIGFQQPIVFNDRNRVRQILVNLISNAIKFTEQGMVLIKANEISDLSDSKIVIFVEDTGIGIAESDTKYIFEPFRQINQTISRKYAGTGLGLAITKSLVKMMDGKVSVESELAKGSIFRVELPRCVNVKPDSEPNS